MLSHYEQWTATCCECAKSQTVHDKSEGEAMASLTQGGWRFWVTSGRCFCPECVRFIKRLFNKSPELVYMVLEIEATKKNGEQDPSDSFSVGKLLGDAFFGQVEDQIPL